MLIWFSQIAYGSLAAVSDTEETVAWIESEKGERCSVGNSCGFGRSKTNTMVLSDERVSRRHAMINAQESGEFLLIDLGSSNGTYLNKRRLTQPTRLTDGDSIEIGGFRFLFRHPGSASAAEEEVTATDKTVQHIRTRECWLLVADIASSTEFVEREPGEESLKLTGGWLEQCRKLIEVNGGTINKFLGDGFFAYWSVESDCRKQVADTLKSLQVLQESGKLRFRVVLHHGPVFVGGAASMGEDSLLGSEVNFVFRMEKIAANEGATRVLSEVARDRLGDLIRTEDSFEKEVQGMKGTFRFYRFMAD